MEENNVAEIGENNELEMEDEPNQDEEKDNSDAKIATFGQLVDSTDIFSTDEVFCSKGAFIAWARKVGKEHGFVVIIKASEKGGGGKKPRIRLACERSGTYYRLKNKAGLQEMSRRSTGTKKCGCQFEIHGVKLAGDDDWGVKVVCGFHNHLPTKQLEGHSSAGRLSDQEKIILSDMTKNMVKPKSILMTLKENDESNLSTIKTIYNARQRLKLKLIENAGRSQMQQLMKQLNEYKYIEWHRIDESIDCVTVLFWAHPIAIDLLHAFPSVLLMDCMYKTNRHRLPLLEIVGVTSTNLTFSVAFVYMGAEHKDNYIWAMEKLRSLMPVDRLPNVIVTVRDLAFMNAVQIVFPTTTNLLCRWHISKDIFANCKKMFERKEKWEAFMSAWNVLVLSSNEDEYQRHLGSLEIDYHTYPGAVQYVRDLWLTPYKERFVVAWTDRIMHFGNVMTNRAEGAHGKLKRHLGSFQGDFESSWKEINSLIELQHTEIKTSFKRSVSVVEHNFNIELFKELRGLVSKIALNMIFVEANRANQVGTDKVVCGCVNRTAYGLPCAHEVAELLRDECPISPNTVHPHWKKLDLVKDIGHEVSSELTIAQEIEAILRRFDTCDGAGKLALKRKLTELAYPSPPQGCI